MTRIMMTYLACPHHHEDKSIMRWRVFKANCQAAAMIRAGMIVFSPLSHNCGLEAMPAGFEFWERQDRYFLEMADELAVLCLAGWEDSVGVQKEIAIAKEMGKPIMYYSEKGIPSLTPWGEPWIEEFLLATA